MKRTSRPGDADAARTAALRLLERRPHAEGELSLKLRRRGFENSAISAAIGRLRTVGLLDDEKFSENFVRWRLVSRPEGRFMLASRLKARGIKRELAEDAVGRAVSDEDETALAAEAARRFLARRKEAGSTDFDKRRRLVSHLARRGFGHEIVAKIAARRFPSARFHEEE